MDMFGRLSDYDVFAYLPQGFFALAALDYFAQTNFILHAEWTVPFGIFVLFLSYATGHVVADPASRILETLVVHRILKAPSVHLLADTQRGGLLSLILPAYFKPLSPYGRQRVLVALDATGKHLRGDDAFWAAYSVAKRDEHAKPRMENFLNVYGFCRNLSFTTAIVAVCMFIEYLNRPRPDYFSTERLHWLAATALGIAAYLLFRRYLKFYRLYSIEVFTTYSALQNKAVNPES